MPLPVRGTQNAEPILMDFATPGVSAPAGVPLSCMSWACRPARAHTPPVPQSVAVAQPFPSFVPAVQ